MQDSTTEIEIVGEDEQSAEKEKFLTFWTDGELFGVPIADVVQIISMQGITPLPDFPAYAKGVINLRGNIIPVIDIRIRFGKPEAEYTDNTCIIVTNIEDSYMGFIVDSVDEVTDIDEDDISPAPKVSKDITNHYLTGIGQIGDRVVLLLDCAKILSENELLEVHDTAVPGGEAGPDAGAQAAASAPRSEPSEPQKLQPVDIRTAAAAKTGKKEE